MIQIKRNNSVIFTLEDFGEGSKLSYQLMDHHYVILKFTTATPVYFEIGDSVDIPDFGYFELTSAYFPKQNDSDGFEYELQMDAYYMSWKNKLCKYRPQHGANETSFKLTTTVGVHMNVVLSNLKALGLTYKGHEFTVDYTTYNSKAFDVQKRFLVEYNSISIIDALNTICSEDALNCEWWVDGSIIYLGFCEMRGQATFEQDVNVLSMSFSESKSTYITRLYAFGSDRNIPKGYFTGSDADVTTDGIATDYLMLPNKEVDSDGFYAKDGYIENVNVVKNEKQAIEGVVMFEDEYPKVSCTVSEVKTYDSTVDNEDGTKTTQTFWQVTSTDAFTTGFETSWVKSNLTLGIKFTSGALTGMEFDVEFKVIDKKKYYEVIANDTYGRTLPDSVMCPKVGDTFFLFNWDATKITDTDLIPTARLSLFGRAKQYYQKTMISNSNFTCTMDGEKFYNDGTYNYHPMGEQVKLINPMFAQVDSDGKHYRNSRIIGMEIALDIPYDHPQYIVGEKAATSRLGKLEDKVDSITVNGIQIGSTGNGNGGGVYIIGLNDFTPASDSNVYSARRSKMEFMSRLNDDTAQNTITWEKVQKFISGLLVGTYNSENGGSWSLDSVGRSHLVTDYLEVRMKAIFEELVIKKTSTIGGKEIISPAGGIKIHKMEEVSVTYNTTEQKAYRCYFLAEQEGDAVDNDFAIDDQVRSESFNLKSGAYHKAGNHFYWRLIIGRDENPVELEGIRYHYIDLSDSDCATDSDIPAIGDTLSQCGNRSDIARQNCLIFSSVDVYSPSVSLYHGINSYSFANKEYVEYGVNKQTDKAFFNVYGDLYIGDRPTKENGNEGASYIKFDSAKKQMEIKAKIDAKSTIGDRDIDVYIKENTLSSDDVKNLINNSEIIGSLQNQIDGAIETWYYDGKPTLENLPAQGWTDDETKNKHIGDLYYDKASGKGYRFLKDATGTYIWVLITDEDITKALALAGEKKRIFGRTPIPPYDVDDLWVYAVYPSDGSKYNKEILRCITAKSAGEKFSIDDWALASDYATNTKVAQLDYLKDALKNDTVVDGGLILSTLIALRDKNKNIQSGINGAVQDTKYKGGGIAAWYGGEMADIEDKDNYPNVTNWAKSLLRFDGSGYLANGNISWETEGKVNIKDLHALINTADTDVLNVLASIYNMFSTRVKESETLILPQLRFGGLFIERLRQEDLDNNDVVLTQKELKDRFVTIDWFNKVFSVVDDKQSDLPVNGNISSGASIHAKMGLWSDGGISALGNSVSSGGTGGGGLDEDMLWSVLGNSGTEQINKSHLTEAMAGYATEEWIEGKGYLTSHQDISGKADRSELSGYLPLTGGTLTGNLNLGGNTLFAEAISLNAEVKNWNFNTREGKIRLLSVNSSNTPTGAPGAYYSGLSVITSYVGFQFAVYGGWKDELYFRKIEDNGVWHNWYRIYNEGFKPTKSDVGLGNVDNTADANKSVLYATTAGSANAANGVVCNLLPNAGSTVKSNKDAIVQYFNNNSGLGANVAVSSFLIRNWDNDSATVISDSVYSFIKISGGYSTSKYAQYLLSSFGEKPVGVIGRSENTWGKFHWIAYKEDIPTKVSQLSNDSGYITSSGSCAYASTAGIANSVAWSNVSGRPTSMPASDVYAWAKAATKPNYTYDEIKVNSLVNVADFTRVVIALCEVTKSQAYTGTFSSGEILYYRSNGVIPIEYARVNFIDSHRLNYDAYYSLETSTENESKDKPISDLFDLLGFRKCTFVYNGKHYAGVEAYFSQAASYYWRGYSHGHTVFGVIVEQNKAIKNEEIYNSLSYDGQNRSGISFGNVRANSFAKKDSSDSYVLLGGGGHALISSLSVATAAKLQTARTIWGQRFDGTSNVDGNLSCNGQGSFSSLQIGNITIIYDEANKGLRIAGGGLYTDSYLSSLGVDASTALSVKKWADSINLTEESDAELATAYSIGNLYRLINSNQTSIQELLNQSVSALQGRCTSLEQRVSALENKVNK